MRRISTCAIAFLTAATAWSGTDAAGSEALRFVRSNAGLVAGIHWKRLVQSPSGEAMRKEIKKVAFAPLQGFDGIEKLLFEDIESLVLATTLNPPGGGRSEPPMLIVVKGKFTASALKPFLGGRGTPEVHRGIEVMAPARAKPPTMRFALLDESTLLAGDRLEVLAAIDRRDRVVAPALLKRAGGLAARFDFWIMADAPPMAPKPQAATAGFDEFVEQVKSFEAGITFTDGLGLDVNVLTKSPEAASKMSQNLQGLLAVAGMTQEGADLADLLRKVHIGADAAAVKMALALDKADMEKLMQKAQARVTMASTAGSAQPPRPARNTIRIEGLEGGPLEIQPPGK